jgi:hypothetical protein
MSTSGTHFATPAMGLPSRLVHCETPWMQSFAGGHNTAHKLPDCDSNPQGFLPRGAESYPPNWMSLFEFNSWSHRARHRGIDAHHQHFRLLSRCLPLYTLMTDSTPDRCAQNWEPPWENPPGTAPGYLPPPRYYIQQLK